MRKLVFQSDFGLSDGAVSAMKATAYKVHGDLVLSDVTHDIDPFNIWEASYRLFQVFEFWPDGTVFVSVVDPGVGSDRKSVVARLENDKMIVTPDNGTLSHLAIHGKILELREIDESVNRLKGSEGSHTFHGRDVYAYTGARLACGAIEYDGVGGELNPESAVLIVKNDIVIRKDALVGTVEILDKRFGHIWSDISEDNLERLNIDYGDRLNVRIFHEGKDYYNGVAPFCKSFFEVGPGDELAYINSMMGLAVAAHGGGMSDAYGIKSGPDWKIEISKVKD